MYINTQAIAELLNIGKLKVKDMRHLYNQGYCFEVSGGKVVGVFENTGVTE
jgi:hypothetical protein